MNEVLDRIAKDMEQEKVTLPENIVFDVKMNSYIMEDNEFEGKLIMVAGRYLCEIEKRDREIKELRKKVQDMNRFNEDLRREYSIPYKQVLSKKIEKGICPATKFVTKQAVKDLEARGKTDAEICAALEISRSTLWRRRRKWEAEEQR